MRERGPLLEVVITYEPKRITLGEDSGFVIDRAVPKAKGETGDYLAPTRDLDEVAGGEHLALNRAQRQKSVDRSLEVVHGYRLSWEEAGLEQHASAEQANKRPEATVGERTHD